MALLRPGETLSRLRGGIAALTSPVAGVQAGWDTCYLQVCTSTCMREASHSSTHAGRGMRAVLCRQGWQPSWCTHRGDSAAVGLANIVHRAKLHMLLMAALPQAGRLLWPPGMQTASIQLPGVQPPT